MRRIRLSCFALAALLSPSVRASRQPATATDGPRNSESRHLQHQAACEGRQELKEDALLLKISLRRLRRLQGWVGTGMSANAEKKLGHSLGWVIVAAKSKPLRVALLQTPYQCPWPM